ncbi:alpha/beta hydrolase [Rhodococcus opacus]|uniref:alpha/beta hydrolase n=1 Tax=Rhodococcus opacus TaxID=37919 RepID=UPI001F542F29|nr:alpha/beta hydrolase [Rhodococcus opacus]
MTPGGRPPRGTHAGRVAARPAAALILTVEVDPIRDDAEARLRRDGLPVSLTRYAGGVHGFVTEIGAFVQAKQAADEVCLHLREAARA